MAIITPALGAARTSLNRRFPDRDKATDGWIGDRAHRGTISGHNPDETGNPEYTDSDSLDEVRAVDLDKDLRHPSLTMHDVVRAILATPADRDRCSYLIYDETIWSRSADYRPRAYTGSNPHTSHLHISGRPTNDADDRPWLSIERLGEDDMPLTKADVDMIFNTDNVIPAPTSAASHKTNTHWTGSSYLASIRNWAVAGAERAAGNEARLAALHAAVTGQDPTEAFRAELDRHRGLLLGALTETLPDALADRLADVPAEQVRAAVREELAALRLVAEAPEAT